MRLQQVFKLSLRSFEMTLYIFTFAIAINDFFKSPIIKNKNKTSSTISPPNNLVNDTETS